MTFPPLKPEPNQAALYPNSSTTYSLPTSRILQQTRGNHRGFTLVELLVTMAVLIILASIGFPSLQEIIKNNRTAGQARELGALLTFARSEAIRQNADIGVLLAGTRAEVCGDVYTDIDSICLPNRLLRQMQFDRVALSRSTPLTFTNRGYVLPFVPEVFDLTHEDCQTAGQNRRFRIERTGQLTITRPGCPTGG